MKLHKFKKVFAIVGIGASLAVMGNVANGDSTPPGRPTFSGTVASISDGRAVEFSDTVS